MRTATRTSIIRSGIILALTGWGGLATLVMLSVPFLFPRWLFFFLLFLALTGTALPLVWYLNRRFSMERFPSETVLWREALETASLGVFLTWLQVDRMFNLFLGWVFLSVLLAVELLLRLYEQSRWSPRAIPPDQPAPEEWAEGISNRAETPPLEKYCDRNP